MRVQIYATGDVRVLDREVAGPVALAAYSAEERLIALRFTDPLAHRGAEVPDFQEQVFRVYRVVRVTEDDVVTVVDFPALEFRSRPTGPQFGPTLTP